MKSGACVVSYLPLIVITVNPHWNLCRVVEVARMLCGDHSHIHLGKGEGIPHSTKHNAGQIQLKTNVHIMDFIQCRFVVAYRP